MADVRGYWYLRLKQDFYKSNEMKILQRMKVQTETGDAFPIGYLYSDILMKMYLESLDGEGRLLLRGMIPYSPEMLAIVVEHPVDVVEKALKIFEELGLIEVLDNGTIYMMDIQSLIGRSSTEADRKREYRQRIAEEKKGEGKEKLALEEPMPKAQGAAYTKVFEELWKEYPRKKEKAGTYKARLNDGFSHEEMMEAVRAYAAECRKRKTEEQFIKQGKTFFGPSTPFTDYIRKQEVKEQEEIADDGANPFSFGK